MPIQLIGLNHTTAPVNLRERLTLNDCTLPMALEEFQQRFGSGQNGHPKVPEAVILSTCNRFEFYAVSAKQNMAEGVRSLVTQFLAQLQNIELDELWPHLYFKSNVDAIDHLFRVASGLDSLILGEPQILGQVNRAYQDAHKTHSTGPILSHLFNQALHTGKRARSETGISRHTTSISHAAARLAESNLGTLEDVSTLIVGAGEMAALAARAVQMHNAQKITIINRTYSSASNLAQEIHGRAVEWDQFGSALSDADLIITATGAPHLVIRREDVAKAMPDRNGRPLLLIDVAVPRDIDPAIDDLPNVIRHDVDDLQNALDENMAQRLHEVPYVEVIVAQEVGSMIDWLNQRQVVPAIRDLSVHARAIAAAEVKEAHQRLHGLDVEDMAIADAAIERLAHRLVKKLLHSPMITLKQHAVDGDGHTYAHVLRELFDLPVETTEPPADLTAIERRNPALVEHTIEAQSIRVPPAKETKMQAARLEEISGDD